MCFGNTTIYKVFWCFQTNPGVSINFLIAFSTFIHGSRWYSELTSPLMPLAFLWLKTIAPLAESVSAFTVLVVKTWVRQRQPRGAYGYSDVGVVIVP